MKKILFTASALLLTTASLPALAWDGHRGHGYGHGGYGHRHGHGGYRHGSSFSLYLGGPAYDYGYYGPRYYTAPVVYQQPVYAQPAYQQARVAPGPAPDDQYCREYQKTLRVGGHLEEGYGTACMQPDGSWEIQN